jgi:hypothetical protein
MTPKYIIKLDRETFTIVAGIGFEQELNNHTISSDRHQSKSELLIAELHNRLGEWIDQFLEEEEI